MPRELREMMVAAAAPSPRVALAPSSDATKVFVLLAAWLLLRKLQWILGPMRRRSASRLVQYGAMAAFYLPMPLLFFAASTVSSSSTHMKALLGSLCFCFLFLSAMSSPAVMKVYTLSDGPLQRWHLLPWLLYFLWLQFDFLFGKKLLGGGGYKFTMSDLAYFGCVYVSPVLVTLLSKSPVDKLDYETNAVADYMVRKARSGSLFTAPDNPNISLQQRCEYPFMQKDDGTWLTIKDDCCQQFEQEDQDTFLSYSLCRLLVRRHFRFGCAEEGDAEVRSLALSTWDQSDYNRAFDLVEVQLAFLHDHFFTDHPTKIHNRGLEALFAVVYCGIGVAVAVLIGYFRLDDDDDRNDYLRANVPTIAVVSLLVYLLEFLPNHYPILLPKYWCPVREIFKHYPAPRVFDRGTRSAPSVSGWWWNYCRRSSKGHKYYWQNKMGQYSLLGDYDHRFLSRATCIDWFQQRLVSHASPGFIRHHPTAEDDVSVPDSIRRLLADTLHRYIKGPPTKGTTSLWRNTHLLVPGDGLLWTCQQEYHTETILIWHIATCYCDMFAVPEVKQEPCNHHEAATALSKYCAYLVAFLPEFLPEHRQTSVIVLQKVLKSAKGLLVRPIRRLSMAKKRSMLQALELPEDRTSMDVFQKGIYLGKQLMFMQVGVRWKVMAEFWAETILYIAPSDDAAAHVERLAKGGEFVTHLWAMLSNAGILRRATEQTTPPPPQPGVQHAAT